MKIARLDSDEETTKLIRAVRDSPKKYMPAWIGGYNDGKQKVDWRWAPDNSPVRFR